MRLPREAEWEYAARADTTASRYGDLDRIAWFSGNSVDQTHDVMQKEPNAWGLYDMLGNVWQSDWYEEGQYRALRSGSWGLNPRDVRASFRGWDEPEVCNNFFGVRCVGN